MSPPKEDLSTAAGKARAAEEERLAAAAAADGAGPSGSSWQPHHDPAPAYEEMASASTPMVVPSHVAPPPGPPPGMPPAATPPGISEGKNGAGGSLPTVEDPFNFPSNAELPAYSPAGPSAGQLPIAIPQARADAASPFVSAYPPSLLGRGITVQAWHSFLSTTSAFLTAKVSDRALSHAADMAKHVGDGPTKLGKGIAAHAKHVGKHIASNAKRGNIIGAAFGVVGGAVSIPVVSALSAAGTATALPGSVVGAIFKRPQTPQQRAEAYAAVANKKWLNDRGLHAQLLTTVQLSQMLGLSETALLGMVQQAKSPSAAYQLRVLASRIAPLDVDETAQLELAPNTLWLVLTI